jgi:transposase
VGIDEKSFLRGHSYVSLLYDLDKSRVLDVVQDRTEESAKNLLQTIPEAKRSEIAATSVDMWPAFIAAIESVLPQSSIAHDKYHVVSHLTKAVDDVRRKENKMLLQEGNNTLKGTRYI